MVKFRKPIPTIEKEFNIEEHVPPREEIPKEFKTFIGQRNKWVVAAEDWFYFGLSKDSLKPKDGIDLNAALIHLQRLLHSFSLEHNHKIAAASYLMSLWFQEYTPSKRDIP